MVSVPTSTCRTVSLLVALFGLCGAAFAKNDSVPPWVSEAAHRPVPSYSAETRAVVLLDETTYTVAVNGTATEHRRHVLKILRPSGRQEAVVAIPFDNATRLRSLKVWSVGPDGREYAMNDRELVDFGYPGQGSLFEDEKVRVAKAPGSDPGGVVAYEYEQAVRPFLTEKTWGFQQSIPSVSESFVLELPPGFTYGTVWAHHARAEAVDLEHQRFRWEMRDVPGIDLEHVLLAPAEDSLSGRMTIHYAGPGLSAPTAGTWPSIGQWYGQLAGDRLASTPEIAAKAQELVAGKTDFYARIEAIGEFVQKQIRYFVIEVGIGGYQPHTAADIFRNRYGDCKDKATLLSAMLSSVGIHSALMMVDTERGVVDPDAPSLMGNHMVAAIEIPESDHSASMRSVVHAKDGRRYLVFDPTWEMTPFGQLEHGLQGGYGILLEGARTEAIRLPVLDPEHNTIHRSATFSLKDDGSLEGTVTERRYGDVSERCRVLYTRGDATEQHKFLDRLLSEDLPSASFSDLKVTNAAALNKEVTLAYSVSAAHFAKPTGPVLMIRPRVLGSDDFPLDRKPRKLPIDLRETMEDRDEYDVKLPAGYTVDELPEPVKLDLGFAAYESASTLTGDTLHYSRTYTVREVTLPPERYLDLQRLHDVIAADEQNRAVLVRR